MQLNDIDNTLTPVMAIQKMRATKIDHTPQSFRFGEKGIEKYRSVQTSKVLQNNIGSQLNDSSYSRNEPGY
jgi:hypothetical protein